MEQPTIPTTTLNVVQASYDFQNERFLCRCQSKQFTSNLHDEYIPLDELRTFCAQKEGIANLVDEGLTLQEWMQQMKPVGINATMTAVLKNRYEAAT